MVDFYTNMSINEFDNYIKELYKIDIDEKLKEIPTINTNIEINYFTSYSSRPSTNVKQHYYYTGSNSLYINADISPENEYFVYTKITNYGAHHPNYPYYDPSQGFSYKFSSDNKTVDCTFECVRYVSQYITDATKYNISCTFTAGGGNIYPHVR